MKQISIFAAGLLIVGLSACSTCYECTYDVEIDNGSTIETEQVTEDVCTADSNEIDEREASGQDCRASSTGA